MKSTTDRRRDMSRISQHSDKMDVHSYASNVKANVTGETLSGAKTPPDSPAKPPSKKGKTDDDISSVIATLSQLINTRSDTIEKMVSENALKIEGLKKTVDFVCSEINVIKDKVNHFETRLNDEEKKMGFCEQRLSDLERYSRRWNLRLQGVPEKEREEVRAESIRICEATFPEGGHSLADKIDTVHRIGRRLQNSSRPRPIIIQFSSRLARDGVWKAARTSEFLRTNQLRFSEDLIAPDRERRRLLWPAVEKARKEGKRAHFMGARAFVDGSEIYPS